MTQCLVTPACLQERDQEIAALTAALERKQDAAQPAPSTLPLPSSSEPPLPRTPVAPPRRSVRLATGEPAASERTGELDQCRAELDQCRAELASRTQGRPPETGRPEGAG